tara:strand:+ start:1416 stop:1598 length:183 start_codon:yes stop_codon:yes gene_type:complete
LTTLREKEAEKANRRPMNRPMNTRPNQKGGWFWRAKVSPLLTDEAKARRNIRERERQKSI